MKTMRYFAGCLIVFLLMVFFPVTSQGEEETTEPLLPELYSKNPDKPLEIVATKVLSKSDEGRHESSQEPGRPFGPSTRELARFKAMPGKGPLYVVIEFTGIEKSDSKTPDLDHYVIVNLHVDCPELQGKCYTPGVNTWGQELFHIGSVESGGMPLHEMKARGVKVRMMGRRAIHQYNFMQETLVVFYASLSVPENVETDQLRFSFVYGEPVTEKPPRGPLRAGANASVVAGMLVLILIFLWARNWQQLEPEDYEDSPKLFGILLSLLGLALAFGGVSIDLLYFIVIGIMLAVNGCLLFFGRGAAIWFYGITLATIWIWSGIEVGPSVLPVLQQVALPSLIGLYLFFSSVSDRLRN